MRYQVSVDGRDHTVEIDEAGVRIDGRDVEVDVTGAGSTAVYSVVLDGRSHAAVARRTGRGLWRFQIEGHDLAVEVVDERTARIRALAVAAGGGGRVQALKAPMPGMVVKVEVQEGETVREGQGLVIVEAMKMENELRAGAEARVARVLVGPGDAVEKDQVLMEFAAEARADAPGNGATPSGRDGDGP